MDPRGVLLFVHGFGSSSACWTRVLDLLRQDPAVMSAYEIRTFDYPTKWLELNVLGRIPRLQEIGRALAAEIDSVPYRGRSLTLVGHSQGGLVILSYLADAVQLGEGSTLRPVRQVILLATPCEGSTKGISLRRIASKMFTNPQELTLRVLNPDVADLIATIGQRIVGAVKDTDISWRIPIHSFCGMQDDVVLEASARGPFDSVRSVPGDHFSILQPKDAADQRYSEVAEVLLDPGGHAHRFEVETYEVVLTVEPRPPQSVKTANKARTVAFDNYATLKRTVRVAPSNRCRDAFTIRYATRNNGYVIGHTSHHNEAPAAEIGRAEDTETYYQFDFTPVPGEAYCLNVEVFGGYDQGSRDCHFHLGNNSHVRQLTYVVDLSAYVTHGYAVTSGPELFFHPEDVVHSELCQTRRATTPYPLASSSDRDVYRWDLTSIETGVVDIVWDVAAASGAVRADGESDVARI